MVIVAKPVIDRSNVKIRSFEAYFSDLASAIDAGMDDVKKRLLDDDDKLRKDLQMWQSLSHETRLHEFLYKRLTLGCYENPDLEKAKKSLDFITYSLRTEIDRRALDRSTVEGAY